MSNIIEKQIIPFMKKCKTIEFNHYGDKVVLYMFLGIMQDAIEREDEKFAIEKKKELKAWLNAKGISFYYVQFTLANACIKILLCDVMHDKNIEIIDQGDLTIVVKQADFEIVNRSIDKIISEMTTYKVKKLPVVEVK